ncbi:MAG: hypothetical protein IJ124_05875 [Clostridia bacterium]|nr:hypothetical protein [Clostridia bacterium]
MKFSKYNNPSRRRRPRVNSNDRFMRQVYTQQYYDALAKCRTPEERESVEKSYDMAMASTGTPKAF